MDEITAGEAEDRDSFDPVVWPLCGIFTSVAGCWLVPRVPESMLKAALVKYLDLADDETLLVLLDAGTEQAPVPVCALTTKRIYWPGSPGRSKARPVDARHASSASRSPHPSRCAYLEYHDLPDQIADTSPGATQIDFGAAGAVRAGIKGPSLDALRAFLAEARERSRGEPSLDDVPFAARDQARQAWPEVLRANFTARELQARLQRRYAAVRDFQERTIVTGRAPVTTLLVGACVLVFVAMVGNGVAPVEPQTDAMLRWGALSTRLVLTGQTWRLATCLFLHFGVLHLALNMWGLVMIGRAVERFYGHVGFAGLYLLAGLGGALASLYMHPIGICAGASGAIFGLIGGLLAFLVVRQRDFPSAIFKPMRRGTLSFIAINLILSRASPSIDMAGHVGGLATGFVVGLCLAPRAVTRPDPIGMLRRLAIIAILGIGLVGIGRATIRATRDVVAGAPPTTAQDPVRAFFEFHSAGQPVLEQIDRTSKELSRVLNATEQGRTPPERLLATINGLIEDTKRNTARVRELPQGNHEIRAMVRELATAEEHLRGALEALRRAVETGDARVLAGPDGFEARRGKFVAAEKAFLQRRDAYLKTHGFTEE